MKILGRMVCLFLISWIPTKSFSIGNDFETSKNDKCEELFEILDSAKFYLNSGDLMMSEKLVNQGFLIKDFCSDNKKVSELYLFKGMISQSLGNSAISYYYYKKAEELDPTDYGKLCIIHINLTEIGNNSNNYDLAISSGYKALELVEFYDGKSDYLKCLAWFNIAQAHEALNEIEKMNASIIQSELILRADRNEMLFIERQQMYLEFGRYYRKNGLLDSAQTYLDLAIENSDGKGEGIHKLRGGIYFAKGEYKKAEEEIQLELKELDTESNILGLIEVYEVYTEILHELGKFDEESNIFRELDSLNAVHRSTPLAIELTRLLLEEEKLRLEQDLIAQDERYLLNEQNYAAKFKTIIIVLSAAIIFLLSFNLRRFLIRKKVKSNKPITKQQGLLVLEEKLRDFQMDSKMNSEIIEKKIEPHKELAGKIEQLMREKKKYLTVNYSIDTLAKQLQSNRQYVSQAINVVFKKNFAQYINGYRIKEAIQILVSDEARKYSIEGLSEHVGFNSKSGFNKFFKEYTGLNPSDFIKSREK